MLVQFVTNHGGNLQGFSAKIHHTLINPICMDWLNIHSGFLNSQEYPTQDCSWVINVSIYRTITIHFHTFEVSNNINKCKIE